MGNSTDAGAEWEYTFLTEYVDPDSDQLKAWRNPGRTALHGKTLVEAADELKEQGWKLVGHVTIGGASKVILRKPVK